MNKKFIITLSIVVVAMVLIAGCASKAPEQPAAPNQPTPTQPATQEPTTPTPPAVPTGQFAGLDTVLNPLDQQTDTLPSDETNIPVQ